MGDLLPRVLDDVGLGATSRAVKVIQAWDRVLGPPFAEHCRPEGMRTDVVVYASEPLLGQIRVVAEDRHQPTLVVEQASVVWSPGVVTLPGDA